MEKKFTVLAVDAGVLNLNTLGNLLAEAGYKALQADCCSEMLKLLDTEYPDLVLLDSSVTDEDGHSALDKLKQNVKYSNIPVILTIRHSEAAEAGRVFEIGAVDYLFVPVSRPELIHRVKMHIELKTYNDTLLRLSRNISRAYDELTSAHGIVNSKHSELNVLIDELDRASKTDFLTELYNRRYMLDKINDEVIRARNTGRTFALLIADIDHFKLVNDNYGHDCGDEVLKSVAKTFKSMVRELDSVARWGGEEFMFLVVEINESDAFAFGERVRSKVENTPIFFNGHRIDITLTLGVSMLQSAPDSASDVISRADNALYTGKNSGRNKVVLL